MTLRLRLIILFTAIIVVVSALQIGMNLWNAEQAENRFNKSLQENYQGHWQKVLELQRDDMLVEQKSLTRDRAITKALRKDQLEDVKEGAFPTYNRLSTSGVIDYLDIFTKNGDVAYSSSGDTAAMDGRTKAAFDSQEVLSGLMTNDKGLTTLEVSFPLYYRGKLTGAVRYAKNLTNAVSDFSEITGTVSLFVSPDGTVSVDPTAIAESLEISKPESTEAFVEHVTLNESHHLVSVIPILAESGELIGALYSVRDDNEAHEHAEWLKLTVFGVSLAVLILAVFVLNMVLGTSLKPLDTAIRTLRDIESGDLETQAWKGQWKGEFAALMSELGRMQEQLLRKTQNEQRYAEENNRTIKALDSVSNAVMVAGADNSIVYANPAATDLVTRIEADIRTVVPGFKAAELLGMDVDIFSSVRDGGGNHLSSIQGGTNFEVAAGTAIVDITANPVSEQDGQRIGTVVEWRDLTVERRVVEEVKNVVADAHAGNLQQRITLEGKDGAFLILSKSVNELITNTEAVIEDTARVFSALAKGDLHESIRNEYSGAYESLKNDANRTVGQLKEVVSNIQHSTGEVRQASSEIDQGNQTLGQSTVETAERLQETSQSVEEMTSAVQQSAENSARASDLVSQANSKAQTGGQVVNQAMGAMEEINESSAKISDITSVINEIAFQTNLLALNAAVESARAGEHGKGFAVVASEVRNLASRCAVAAKEIQDLIAASIEKVENGQRLVNQTGTNLHDIVGSIEEISGLVAEISTSGKEQAVGLEQINQAITEIDNATQRNTEMVRQVSSASAEAFRQSNELSEAIRFFSATSESFSGAHPVLPDQAA